MVQNTIIASPAYIAGSVPVQHTCLPSGRHQLQLNLRLMNSPILEIDVAPNHVRAGLMLLRMTALALGATARGGYNDLRIELVDQIIDITIREVVRARHLDPVCFEGTVSMSARSVPVRLVPGARDTHGTQEQILHLVSPAKLEACATEADAHAAVDAVAAHDQWVGTTARSLALDIPAAGPASGFDAAMEEAQRTVARKLPDVADRFRRPGRRLSVDVNLAFEENQSVGAVASKPRAQATNARTDDARAGAKSTTRRASGIVTKWSKNGMVTCHLYFNGLLMGDIVTVPESCIVDFVAEDLETHWTGGGFTHRVRADYGM